MSESGDCFDEIASYMAPLRFEYQQLTPVDVVKYLEENGQLTAAYRVALLMVNGYSCNPYFIPVPKGAVVTGVEVIPVKVVRPPPQVAQPQPQAQQPQQPQPQQQRPQARPGRHLPGPPAQAELFFIVFIYTTLQNPRSRYFTALEAVKSYTAGYGPHGIEKTVYVFSEVSYDDYKRIADYINSRAAASAQQVTPSAEEAQSLSEIASTAEEILNGG